MQGFESRTINKHDMKYIKVISGLGAILVIIGAILKILHLAYGNTILLTGCIVTIIFQAWYVAHLEKKIKVLTRD